MIDDSASRNAGLVRSPFDPARDYSDPCRHYALIVCPPRRITAFDRLRFDRTYSKAIVRSESPMVLLDRNEALIAIKCQATMLVDQPLFEIGANDQPTTKMA